MLRFGSIPGTPRQTCSWDRSVAPFTIRRSGATTGRRWKMFRPFVQDDWRVTPNLTLNIGLAWALTTPIPKRKAARQTSTSRPASIWLQEQPAIAGCAICIRSGWTVGVAFDKSALEPRIGLAWKPLGSQNTAIRAGYAIFHDSSWNQGAQGLWQNPPYYAEVDHFGFFPGGPCPVWQRHLGSAAELRASAWLFSNPTFSPLRRHPTLPPSPEPFSPRTLISNKGWCSSSTSTSNTSSREVLSDRWVRGLAQHAHSVDGLNENVVLRAHVASCSGYTLGCGPGGAAFTAPYGPFTLSPIIPTPAALAMTLCKSRQRRSARHGLYALLGYTWSRTFDSGFPDGAGTFPERPTGHCRERRKRIGGCLKSTSTTSSPPAFSTNCLLAKASIRQQHGRRRQCGPG